LSGAVVTRAIGKKRVAGAIVRTQGGTEVRLFCELIAMSGGWNPNIQLTTHLGSKPIWNDRLHCFLPGGLPTEMLLGGAVSGDVSLAKALAGGAAAGASVVSANGAKPIAIPVPKAADESDGITPLWRVKKPKGKAFVDFQNDVTDKDVELAE